MPAQPGILADLPTLSRAITFRLRPDVDPVPVMRRLVAAGVDEHLVVGLGAACVDRLGGAVEGLTEPPSLGGQGISIPTTPAALWCWLRGDDRGELIHRQRALVDLIGEAFAVDSVVDTFVHAGGRDLSGYEDGTENPKGEAAAAAALVRGQGRAVDGGSFLAVQLWQHDMRQLMSHDQQTRDHIVGRRASDNEELDDAPPSAHVKRTAQEGFEPPAFLWRRSMPWADAAAEGLLFIAFASSFRPFEVQMRRMVGLDDGITDGLFRFTRPLTTSYLFCPPVDDDGRLIVPGLT